MRSRRVEEPGADIPAVWEVRKTSRLTELVFDGAGRPDQRLLVRILCCQVCRARIAAWRRRHHQHHHHYDNLSSHKGALVRERIEAADANLRFHLPDSSDFNPIEKAFSLLRATLRKIGEWSVNGLWDVIGRLVDSFSPANAPTTSGRAAVI